MNASTKKGGELEKIITVVVALGMRFQISIM